MVQYGREHGQQFSSTWSRAAGDSSSGVCSALSATQLFQIGPFNNNDNADTTRSRKRGEVDRGRQALEQASKQAVVEQGGGRAWWEGLATLLRWGVAWVRVFGLLCGSEN